MAPPKTTTPPAAPTVTLYSLTLLPTKRLGQPEHTVAVVKTVGDKVVSITPLADGNYDRIEDALRDLMRTATQGYRFKNWDLLLAGKA